MYNPYQGASQYGRPGDYGAFPGAPPGMAPPPGMAAPGTNAPPGMMQQQEAHLPGRPGGFPPSFQPPANMPNINFSAPVIRLGTTGGKQDGAAGGRDDRERGGRRPGLGSGMAGESRGERDRPLQVQPQTKEEIIKTIFVGGITEGIGGDEGVERILRAAGSLRKWFRATDADDKPCKFGFAEYDDPESLRTAIEVLKDIQVPTKRREPKDNSDSDEEDIEKSTLLIVADENSMTYIEQWEEKQGDQNDDHKQMLFDHAREALEAVLRDLDNPSAQTKKETTLGLDHDGDTEMANGQQMIDAVTGEVLNIPLSIDDELADIPAEMRETVAKEIASFRDRSNKRDMERLKREEEAEQQERSRTSNGRPNRLASPPPSAPSGPSGSTNGIPVGPRGAPSGPKAFGQQIPRDYQKGVTFVNGTIITGSTAFEGEDTDASDNELERRRQEKKTTELEKQYLDQERRWLNRERSRTAAIEREQARDEDENVKLAREKEAMATRLKQWDDDAEASRKAEEYYADRSQWIRNRASFRQREQALDEADRAAEQRERARDFQQRERTDAMADDFLSRQDEEISRHSTTPTQPKQHSQDSPHHNLESKREPARFKLSLGAAAQQHAAAAAEKTKAAKRTVAEVEGLLEDEEETDTTTRRTLIPIQFDKADAAVMTDEERAAAAKQLAADIPTDKSGLWTWDIKWDYVDETVIEDRLKPFVERKIVEYLGVQEDLLVEVVVGALRSRKKPDELVGELEGALDEEAEVLVRKLWRMVIFFSESEKRGLSA